MIAPAAPVIRAEGLTKEFPIVERRTWWGTVRGVRRAVSGVTFELRRGEVLGIVGESGSGKTTLARMLLRLIEPTAGRVMLDGQDIMGLTPDEVRARVRPAVRMIFQNPDAALNPGYTIGEGLRRAIRLHPARAAEDLEGTIATLLRRVGLDPSYATKFPDELSGGEKRRVGICRALATSPDVIVADEPLSGLDVVLQERILELLKREQEERGFALILVSHDLDRVNQMCDRVMVMHGGRVVEEATLRRDAGPIREQYRHPYSVLLQRARVDVAADGERVAAHDDERDGSAGGCTFAPACDRRRAKGDPDRCWQDAPPLETIASGQTVACHFAHDVT